MKTITIYSDGSGNNLTRIGGWGAVILIGDDPLIVELSGCKKNTTSNRMEMMAALQAMKAVATKCNIRLITDSQYLIRGIKARGWQSRGSSVPNADLWRLMVKQIDFHNVKPEWVRGHTGVEFNERADELAGIAMRKLTKRLEG